MPPKNRGMRKPTEERGLLSELSKMFHVLKAHHKEQRNGRRAVAQAPISAKKSKKDTRRGSQRRSQNGGSIWIVLKGGFAPHSVPTAAQSTLVDARAKRRSLLSEQHRVAAVKEAESYVESAWQQAREAGLIVRGNIPTEEADVYLAEQYALASAMLRPPPVGVQLHQLINTHCTCDAMNGVEVGALHSAPEFQLSHSEWEELCTREAAILFRYRTHATPAGTAEDYINEQRQARETQYHFPTAEPTSAGGDVAATKCIVRIRDSQRDKHTSILSTAKAVNYFKSNFGQVLRKELSSSQLPRAAAEDVEEAMRNTHAGHQSGSHPGNNSGNTNSSKRKKRR